MPWSPAKISCAEFVLDPMILLPLVLRTVPGGMLAKSVGSRLHGEWIRILASYDDEDFQLLSDSPSMLLPKNKHILTVW